MIQFAFDIGDDRLASRTVRGVIVESIVVSIESELARKRAEEGEILLRQYWPHIRAAARDDCDLPEIMRRFWMAAARWEQRNSAPSGLRTLVQYIARSVAADRARRQSVIEKHSVASAEFAAHHATVKRFELGVELFVDIERLGDDAVALVEAILDGDKKAVANADPSLVEQLKGVLGGS